ncbi:uncharacterized mitochondrial protein AtMg00810-like [Helianthus annuus]|uniref:uncharacterized mitochondrial protein AtMg00810-like n=1 Tax=Helianthus annuus TaxID=4232 RepID=UPI000B8FA200|nr:uncharacterized mitochondrial protein AtMg00810-like [Helianthus annuus]
MANVCPQRYQPQPPRQQQPQPQQQQQQVQEPARGRAFLLTTAQAQNANDVITGEDYDVLEPLKHDLAHWFAMNDLGLLRYFLGIVLAQSKKGYILSQTKYLSDSFKWARLTNNRTIDTPLKTNACFSPTNGVPLSDLSLHHTIVGCLVYLTLNRPDITLVVHVVSQFFTAPTSIHRGVVLRILRYTRGIRFQTLLFPSTSSLDLRAYSDANWDSNPNDRKSTTGFYVFIGDLLIS